MTIGSLFSGFIQAMFAGVCLVITAGCIVVLIVALGKAFINWTRLNR